MQKSSLLIALFLLSLSCKSQEEKSQPKAFAAEQLLDFPNVRDLTISSSGNEAYFTAQSYLGELSVIMRMEKEDDIWQKPQIAPFSGQYMDLEAFLSPDGLKLFFASDRPSGYSPDPQNYDIWYVSRKNAKSSWSSPKNIGTTINTKHGEFYPSVSLNGNLYFTSDRPELSKGKDDIFYSEWKDGAYSNPISLSGSINSLGHEYNALISPNEDILIFGAYNRAEGYGSGDLYISYRQNNEWTTAENMGAPINSDQMDYCPFIDEEGRLYFTSKRSQLKSGRTSFANSNDLLDTMNGVQNGLSRLYWVMYQ